MIRQLEVDGVPALLAPTAGPAHAGLMFRVGQADETLDRRGITHLLEHLVLYPLGAADYHYNGTTGSVVTHFHLQGSVDDITTFLTGACKSLRDLPASRVETEKAILRTEWNSRSGSSLDGLPLWRYGARSHGLLSYPEWGLHAVSLEDLQDWARRYFTKENAVLWLAGAELPAGLRIDLPSGRRMPVPAPSSALPQTPAFFAGSGGLTAVNAIVPRSVTASVFAGVLERELFQALRQRDGLSYTAATNYEPRGDGYATITALADALPEKQDAVLGGFIDVLAKVRVGRIDEANIAAVIGKATESLSADDADNARLASAAFDVLTGEGVTASDDLLRQVKEVTPEAVHEVATDVLADSLLMTPYGRSADWAGFIAAPTSSATKVTGTDYPGRGTLAQRLVIGTDGVSLVSKGSDEFATVHYDTCAALLTWPDGGRQLLGEDGISIRLEPTLYQGLTTEAVDQGVPAQLRVKLPARDPEEIPQPPPVSRRPGLLRRFTTFSTRKKVRVVTLSCIAGGVSGISVPVLIGVLVGQLELSVFGIIGSLLLPPILVASVVSVWREPG
ncbi:M16 family metallopeptidase [Salinispora tropica]|uniref:Peptidase M16 domain protein n=1 Tax=Salinispora tropica (strain ATCC BAA-916 / DSM 44818 / JCM 13857 / NBRC 105044 / CNB-440) TaxID=369723 RepID=A4X8I2_SALTO|nr:insulinase family protein [Salinispora tropica]ABP55182.1 peptidase M16 domain protein [Salinispora tropica CNB-440]